MDERRRKMRRMGSLLFIYCLIFYLSYLLYPVFKNKLTGTFSHYTIPLSYITLAQKLAEDKSFYRTFWVPTVPTYSFYSFNHPQISAEDWLQVTDTRSVLHFLQQPKTQETLQEMGVKYIIIPLDSEEKIFLTERRYDNKKYLATIASVQKLPWLRRVSIFGNFAVFQINNPRDHIWLLQQKGKIAYQFVNPTKYAISLQHVSNGEKLIFAEAFDSKWILQLNNQKIYSANFNHMNSFTLPQNGNYHVVIFYEPQKFVWYGVVISIISFIFFSFVLIYLYCSLKKNEE